MYEGYNARVTTALSEAAKIGSSGLVVLYTAPGLAVFDLAVTRFISHRGQSLRVGELI